MNRNKCMRKGCTREATMKRKENSAAYMTVFWDVACATHARYLRQKYALYNWTRIRPTEVESLASYVDYQDCAGA
jgi:hypothetical protein